MYTYKKRQRSKFAQMTFFCCHNANTAIFVLRLPKVQKMHILSIEDFDFLLCYFNQIVCKKFKSVCLRLSGILQIRVQSCWSWRKVAKLAAKNSSTVQLQADMISNRVERFGVNSPASILVTYVLFLPIIKLSALAERLAFVLIIPIRVII